MELNPDFQEFLRSFVTHDVRFLIVGGYALAAHGHPRYTKDLDVWVWTDPSNARRVVAALEAFGFGGLGLTPADFEEMRHVLGIEEGSPETAAQETRRRVLRAQQRLQQSKRTVQRELEGELSLLDHGPRTATVTCDTDCELLLLDQRNFIGVLDSVPTLAHKLLATLAGRIRELDRQNFG